MPLVVDASTPARVNKPSGGPTSVTASFNPPTDSVLVFCGSGDGETNSFTVSNNDATLEWARIAIRNATEGINGCVDMQYTALNAARTGMTVTADFTDGNDTSFKVYVLTGADLSDILGGFNEGSTQVASVNTAAYTSEAADSLSVMVFNDYNANTSPTSSDSTIETGGVSGQITSGSAYKTIDASGMSVTHQLTVGGTPTNINYITAEFRVTPTVPPVLIRVPVDGFQIP